METASIKLDGETHHKLLKIKVERRFRTLSDTVEYLIESQTPMVIKE